MSPAKTAAERNADKRQLSQKPEAIRKRRERENNKTAGRVPVTVNVLKEYVPEVRALEAKLQRHGGAQREIEDDGAHRTLCMAASEQQRHLPASG